VLPEDDLRIEICRSVLNVLVQRFYTIITVHSLVCNKLNISKMHGVTIKIIRVQKYTPDNNLQDYLTLYNK
jgi:hypothetical protein